MTFNRFLLVCYCCVSSCTGSTVAVASESSSSKPLLLKDSSAEEILYYFEQSVNSQLPFLKTPFTANKKARKLFVALGRIKRIDKEKKSFVRSLPSMVWSEICEFLLTNPSAYAKQRALDKILTQYSRDRRDIDIVNSGIMDPSILEPFVLKADGSIDVACDYAEIPELIMLNKEFHVAATLHGGSIFI
jgi:hypothetical protein